MHVKRGQEVREFATGPGFFKVEQDRALALVDDAVDVDEIDRERAQAQLETAQAELVRVEAGDPTPTAGSSSSASSTPRTSSRSRTAPATRICGRPRLHSAQGLTPKGSDPTGRSALTPIWPD